MKTNADNVKVFRSKLDEDLIDVLSPLKKHNAVVYFPFFANTFPLAFHYSCLLANNRIDPKQIDRQIKFVSWGGENHFVKIKNPRSPLVFYSTLKNVKDERHLARAHVTDFLPCFVFTEFNLKVWATSNLPKDGDELPKANFKDVVRALAKEKAFDYFEVFTEIPEQAKALFGKLFRELRLKHRIIETTSATWIFDETHLSQNTLRLFLYGAPLTNYLSHKRQRFIPFRIQLDGAKESKESFQTVIAVNGEANRRKAIVKVLDEYHFRLYKAAREEKDEDRQGFRTIQYHYNRVARLLQHRSAFHSSQEYARCLADHHQMPETQITRVPSSRR